VRILYTPLSRVNSGEAQFTALINNLSNISVIWPHAAR